MTARLIGHAFFDQRPEVIGSAAHARVLRLHVGVEGAAEGEVVAHPAQSGDVDRLVQRQHEGGHVVEADARDLAAGHPGAGGDQTGRACRCARWSPGLCWECSPVSSATVAMPMMPWPHMVL